MPHLKTNSAVSRSIGEILLKRRVKLNLSQEEVGQHAGLNRTYVSDIERGERNISIETLLRLSAALRLRASSVLRQAETEATEVDGHAV